MTLRRRSLLAAGAALVAGCVADKADPARPGGAAAPVPLLSPWMAIGGAWRVAAQPLMGMPLPARERINFLQPVGVAAQGDVLLVADIAARTLWRVERSRDTAAPFGPFVAPAPEAAVSLQLDHDFTAWLASPAEHAVLQYDLQGRVVRRFRDDANVPRPIAVAVPRTREEVFVADAATQRLYAWDTGGRVVRAFGPPRLFQGIAAMAFGPRGLYVLDRLAQQVVVLGGGGDVVELLGEQVLVQPRALAVDASGRVFVGDGATQQIHVFRGTRLVGSAGGTGASPGRFGRIEAMAVDGNLLYVADSMNARVQAMLVAPAAMEEGAR